MISHNLTKKLDPSDQEIALNIIHDFRKRYREIGSCESEIETLVDSLKGITDVSNINNARRLRSVHEKIDDLKYVVKHNSDSLERLRSRERKFLEYVRTKYSKADLDLSLILQSL